MGIIQDKINQAVAELSDDSARMNVFVNGDDATEYTANDGSKVPSIKKYLRRLGDLAGGMNIGNDGGVVVQQPFSGAIARTQHEKNKEQLSILDFDVDPSGIKDSTLGVKKFIEAVMQGSEGKVMPGTYLVGEQIVFDMGISGYSRNQGFRVRGDGLRRSIFKSTVANKPAFIIKNSSAIKAAFYPEILGVGFESNAPFPTICIGSQDLSDEINAVRFNFSANNANTMPAACALEINGVYQGEMNITCNTGGTSTLGDSVRVRQGQFLQITGSGGNSAHSVRFVDGYSFGNVFLNWDAEEVRKCIKIESPNAANNTFIGGQFIWSEGCIDAVAGSNNRFLNPNFGLSTNVVLGATGIHIDGDGKCYGRSFLPPARFKNQLKQDSFNYFDSIYGYRSGVVFSENNVDKAMIDRDSSGNLVIRMTTDGGASWTTAMYINPSGICYPTKMQINGAFGLNAGPVGRQTVTGSKGGNAALASLLDALSNFGLINNSTT